VARPNAGVSAGDARTEEPLTTQPTKSEVGDEAPASAAASEQLHAVPFRDLGVDEVICASLDDAGIHKTFPIQALTLPLAIDGQDIIGQARTGTGKTLAFGVPMLHRLATTLAAARAARQPAALIIVPTRELAIQVADDIKQAGTRLGARVLTVYGGRAYEPQIEALTAGTDIVVGTPGRLLDLANRKNLDLSQIHALVLDEADKMLDLGFLPDVEKLLRLTPADRQTMLFSATMPGEVVTLARRHMRRPTNIRAEEPDESAPPPLTTQYVYRTHHLDKIEVLARVLQAKDRGLAMVFCQTKRACDQVSTALADRGFAAATVHGDLGQAQRERALRAFRSGKVDVLVATDVAARGIDVDDVTHVVNYECPDDEKTYLHRIGRTGRAGRPGVAVTFVDWRDMQRWKLIDAALGIGQPEPAETYSTSEHLFTDLSIPPGASGSLPRELRGTRAGLAAEAEEDLGETGPTRSQRRPSGGKSRSRSRSRSRRAGDGTGSGDDDAVRALPDTHSESGEATEPRAPRRRRRTRGGRDVTPEAAAESAVPPESTQQAS
jgi:superfamily II DNA/RNA helicase